MKDKKYLRKKANNLMNRWERLHALCLQVGCLCFRFISLFLFQGLKALTSRCHLQQFCSKHLTLRWTSTSMGWLTNNQWSVWLHVCATKPCVVFTGTKCRCLDHFWSLRWWDHHLYLIMFFYNYAVIYKSRNKILFSYTVNCQMLVYCLKCVLLPCVVLLCAHHCFF